MFPDNYTLPQMCLVVQKETARKVRQHQTGLTETLLKRSKRYGC